MNDPRDGVGKAIMTEVLAQIIHALRTESYRALVVGDLLELSEYLKQGGDFPNYELAEKMSEEI